MKIKVLAQSRHVATNRLDQRKHAASVIALISILAISSFMVLIPAAEAHTPPWSIPTFIYVTTAPNPVGVNQQVTVLYWLNQPPPTAAGSGGDRWRNITIEVTKPDSTKQTLGPFTSDDVGTGYTLYKPDQTGTYNFTVKFPGQKLSLSGPTGIPGSDSPYINDTYQSSTAPTTLTVQQSQILPPTEFPLPSGYWTRPIEGQNTNWDSIASNWLSSPQIVLRVQPNGVAPDTAHVLWVKPYQYGGVAGGTYATSGGMTYYTGLNYEAKFQTPIIINGQLFYEQPLANDNRGGGFACLDLRSGNLAWKADITGISFGQLYDYESLNQHGIIPNGYLWRSVTDARNGGTVWMAYDPLTAKWLFNETNVPAGTQAYGPNGEILVYQMNYTGRWLAMWNNTAAPDLAGAAGTGSSAFQWRPNGKNVNASAAYSWNVTIPTLAGLSAPSILRVIPDDIVLGCSSTFPTITVYGGTQNPYTLWALSLKPATRGQLLWIKNYSAPANNITRTLFADPGLSLVDPKTRIFVMHDDETLQNWGYSLDNGTVMWGPTPSEKEALGFYFSTGGQLSAKTIAYGNFYSAGYGGVLYCYDLTTGKVKWTYGNGGAGNSTNSGLATPYGNYPIGTGAIADGKIYLFSSEHSPNSPYWKNAKIRCVDANTGKELWSLYGYSGIGTNNGMAVADGVLVYLNTYDMQLYAIGKGPSQTTVSATSGVGSTVTIQGTVTDQSAGAKQIVQIGQVNSVPAVSDADMGSWMEYLYMQKPMPANATGVPVTIYISDQNHNVVATKTAATDISGHYAIQWNPSATGIYTITVAFDGTKAYYASTEETAIAVGPTAAAPVATTTPAPTAPALPTATTTQTTTAPTQTPAQTNSPTPKPVVEPPTSNNYTALYIGIAAIVIIIAIIAAAALLRRSK